MFKTASRTASKAIYERTNLNLMLRKKPILPLLSFEIVTNSPFGKNHIGFGRI